MVRARKPGQGSKWIRRTTRAAIYLRDGFACVYCGACDMLTIDHLRASVEGGSNAPSNLVTACLSCNSARQHRSLRAWFAILRARGVNTRALGARIRRRIRKPLDRVAGRKIARTQYVRDFCEIV